MRTAILLLGWIIASGLNSSIVIDHANFYAFIVTMAIIMDISEWIKNLLKK